MNSQISEIKQKLFPVLQPNNISYLGVFGSWARGEAHPGSDLDLLVRFHTQKSLLDLVRLERELGQLLGQKVDLVTEDSISPYLKNTIKSEVQTIYD